jgi:DtxR family Mn-dependent transcriptional regulator
MSENNTTPSMEDYLKAIAVLKEQGRKVTVTALSKLIGVKKPSVDWAISRLSEAGLVIHKKYRDVKLTTDGAMIATDIYHRHKTLHRFLTDILNVDSETANTEACRMEHILSRSSLSKLEKLTDFVLGCPRGNHQWSKNFNYYVKYGRRDRSQLARCLSND